MLLSPARQGSRLTRLGVFGPPGWCTRDKSLDSDSNLWIGTGFDWIKGDYPRQRQNKRTRRLPVSFHRRRGFFCSSTLMCEMFLYRLLCFDRPLLCQIFDRTRALSICVIEAIVQHHVSLSVDGNLHSSGVQLATFPHLCQQLKGLTRI
jgi:hypothetical protein